MIANNLDNKIEDIPHNKTYGVIIRRNPWLQT